MATLAPTKPAVKVPDRVPALSPFVLHLLLCPTCAEVVLPTLKRLASGRIVGIAYYHTNEEFGCAWKVVDHTLYAGGQTLGLKESERDGNDQNGHPIFVNERDLAAGRSFPLDGLRPQVPLFVGADSETPLEEIVQTAQTPTQTPKPHPAKAAKAKKEVEP